MVVTQLPGWNSLRDIVGNVSAQMHQLNHLRCRGGQKNNGRTCYRTFEFTGAQISNRCPTQPCLISYKCALTGKHQAFLTNSTGLLVCAIADIYKARWQVELSFERIDLSLKMKIFARTIKNAVLTRIAVCGCLILALIRFPSRLPKGMQQILLQLTLGEKQAFMGLRRRDHVNSTVFCAKHVSLLRTLTGQ